MNVTLNTSDFDRKMQRLVNQTIPERAVRAMGKAGMQLLNDSVMEAPTVPLDEGTLRGSGSVFVENELVGTSPFFKKKGNPAIEHSESRKQNQVKVVVGFNTPYAAKLHEGIGIRNWSEPGSGPKYLESKLARNRHTYMRIAANDMKASS